MFFLDFGMVWMGDMLLQNESNDLMMEPVADSPFFVDGSGQALSDDEIRCRNQMVYPIRENLFQFSRLRLRLNLITFLSGYGRIHDVGGSR